MDAEQLALNGFTFTLGYSRAMTGDWGEAERSFRREYERCSGMIPNTIGDICK